jgi:hypothetical protein
VYTLSPHLNRVTVINNIIFFIFEKALWSEICFIQLSYAPLKMIFFQCTVCRNLRTIKVETVYSQRTDLNSTTWQLATVVCEFEAID